MWKLTTLKTAPILRGKRYVVDLYKKNIHAKNHVDWIKIEVTTEVQSLPV